MSWRVKTGRNYGGGGEACRIGEERKRGRRVEEGGRSLLYHCWIMAGSSNRLAIPELDSYDASAA